MNKHLISFLGLIGLSSKYGHGGVRYWTLSNVIMIRSARWLINDLLCLKDLYPIYQFLTRLCTVPTLPSPTRPYPRTASGEGGLFSFCASAPLLLPWCGSSLTAKQQSWFMLHVCITFIYRQNKIIFCFMKLYIIITWLRNQEGKANSETRSLSKFARLQSILQVKHSVVRRRCPEIEELNQWHYITKELALLVPESNSWPSENNVKTLMGYCQKGASDGTVEMYSFAQVHDICSMEKAPFVSDAATGCMNLASRLSGTVSLLQVPGSLFNSFGIRAQ